MTIPGWPPRDWRMLLALLFLAGGGVACTIFAAAALYAIAWEPWPDSVAALRIRWLGYLGLAALALIGVVLTSYGFVLGRRAWKAKGPGGLEFEASGGEDDDALPIASAGPAAGQP
ncbi:hypothetical protein EIK56_22915 [Sphingomonas sp. C8-2]|uniref:hypothetical protein n=1 Tax=Rhizorhabdus histidinilytica TaxID=439228 RepID=UPI000F7970CB|nr:hypothetical protein EIK56_22915 [Sphingomonas sp. C8-2]